MFNYSQKSLIYRYANQVDAVSISKYSLLESYRVFFYLWLNRGDSDTVDLYEYFYPIETSLSKFS